MGLDPEIQIHMGGGRAGNAANVLTSVADTKIIFRKFRIRLGPGLILTVCYLPFIIIKIIHTF
jgi:hypothetical protein